MPKRSFFSFSGVLVRFSAGCLALMLLPAIAHAERDGYSRPGHGYRHGPIYGHVGVSVRGHRYSYHDGFFYEWGPRGYFLVDAPFGVVVPFLPLGAVRLHFGPDWFFYFGGIYYQPFTDGYVVVKKPDTVYVAKDAAPTAPAAPAEPVERPFVEPNTKTVMVENSNGSRTPVILQEVEGKWKGPRGEIYDKFPTDDQLHSAYGF